MSLLAGSLAPESALGLAQAQALELEVVSEVAAAEGEVVVEVVTGIPLEVAAVDPHTDAILRPTVSFRYSFQRTNYRGTLRLYQAPPLKSLTGTCEWNGATHA